MKSISDYLRNKTPENEEKIRAEFGSLADGSFSSQVIDEINELQKRISERQYKPSAYHVTYWRKRSTKSKVGKRVVLVKYQAVYAYS